MANRSRSSRFRLTGLSVACAVPVVVSISLAGVFAAGVAAATVARADHGSAAPLVWRPSPSGRYIVPLPKSWRLRTTRKQTSEIDSWVDPNDRAARLVVTIRRCARCASTALGGPNPKALVPKGLRVTSVTDGHAAFTGMTVGNRFTEHGLVIVTRDSRGVISGALVVQLWLGNTLAPGSENREWSYILDNLAAKKAG